MASDSDELRAAFGAAWAVIEACPHRDPADGCCLHETNPTPECHGAVCPLPPSVCSKCGQQYMYQPKNHKCPGQWSAECAAAGVAPILPGAATTWSEECIAKVMT